MTIYKTPLIYVYGTTALYFFQLLPVPAFLSSAILFFARRIYMVHVFGKHPCIWMRIRPWPRWNEMIGTPLLSLLNSFRMLGGQALAGITLDLVRERLFDQGEKAISWTVTRGEAVIAVFRDTPAASQPPMESAPSS
jgi:hypothetical protein